MPAREAPAHRARSRSRSDSHLNEARRDALLAVERVETLGELLFKGD